MTPATQKQYRVLVTGSAGAVGRVVCHALQQRGHTVRGFDRVPSPNLADAHVGSIADPAALNSALDGMDTLVHLAANPNPEADFLTDLLEPNIIGVYQVLDAAVRAKLRRAVLTSSVQAVGSLWDRPEGLYRMADGTAPENPYAATKVFAETLGYVYHHRHQLSVLAVRLGLFLRGPRGLGFLARNPRQHPIYISHNDAGRFFIRAVEETLLGYGVAFALSRNALERFDMAPTRTLIGYEPQDAFPDGTGELPGPTPGPPPRATP